MTLGKRLLLFVLVGVLLSSFASASLTDDLVAYYKFDEGSGNTAVNLVDGTKNLSFTNSPTWSSISKIGPYSVNFSSNSNARLNTTSSFSLNNPFSYSLWVNRAAFKDLGGALRLETSASNYLYLIERSDQSNKLVVQARVNSGLKYTDGVVLSNNQYHHVVIVKDGSNNLKLYVDSIEVGNISNADFVAGSTPLVIGNIGTSFVNNWNGVIDEVGVWNRSLSASEVEELYLAQLPGQTEGQYPTFTVDYAKTLNTDIVSYWKFDEGSGTTAVDSLGINNGTITGANWTSSGKINSALNFTSINNYINTNIVSNTLTSLASTGMTYSTWVSFNSVEGQPVLITNYDGGTYAKGDFYLEYSPTEDKWTIQVGNNAGSGSQKKSSSTWIPNVNQWYHIVLVLDPSNSFTLYIDDTIHPMSYTQGSFNLLNFLDTSTDLYIGSYPGIQTPNSIIDEVGLWERPLTSTEISALYNSDLGVQYPFSLNATVTARDLNTNALIEDFNLTLVSNETITYNNVDGSIQTDILSNDTRLWNITIDAENYLSYNVTDYNFSANGSLTAFLYSGSVTFGAFDLVSNLSIDNFNITVDGTTKNNSEIFALSIGTYNATFSKAGYYNKTEEFEVVFGTDSYNFTGVFSNKHNVTLKYQNGSAVTYGDYNITVTQPQTGFTAVYSGNGSISNSTVLNLTQGYDYTLVIETADFKTETVTTGTLSSLTTAQNVTLMQEGFTNLSVLVYDETTNSLINGNTNLVIDRYISTNNYTVVNGNLSVLVPELNASLRYVFSKDGYSTRQIINDYTGQRTDYENISIFLVNSSDPNVATITFRVTDTEGTNLVNAFVTIKTLTPEGTIIYEEKTTDIAGLTTSSLDITKTYTIEVAKTGYVPQTFTIDFSSNEYLIVLKLDVKIDPTLGFGGISYTRSPVDSVIAPNSTNFQFNITDPNGTLSTVVLRVVPATNRLMTIGVATYSNVNFGVNGSVLVNLFPYYNQSVYFIVKYTLDNGESITEGWAYLVKDQTPITGSLSELRNYLINNISLFQRGILFIFLFLVTVLIFAVFLSGGENALFSVIVSGVYAYILFDNLYIVGFLYAVILIVITKTNDPEAFR